MNLAKLALFSGPLMLASLALVSVPAVASPLPHLAQYDNAQGMTNHVSEIALLPPSDQPRVPTGCSCARCTQAEELLRGQLPVF